MERGKRKRKREKGERKGKKERKSPALVDGARRGKELQGAWWVGLANAFRGFGSVHVYMYHPSRPWSPFCETSTNYDLPCSLDKDETL